MQTLKRASLIRQLTLPLLLALASTACAGDPGNPGGTVNAIQAMDFSGLDFNLQIEKTQGPAATSHPNQGAIVRHILRHGQWRSAALAYSNHREASGSSQWRRNATGAWVETSTDATGNPASSVPHLQLRRPEQRDAGAGTSTTARPCSAAASPPQPASPTPSSFWPRSPMPACMCR